MGGVGGGGLWCFFGEFVEDFPGLAPPQVQPRAVKGVIVAGAWEDQQTAFLESDEDSCQKQNLGLFFG